MAITRQQAEQIFKTLETGDSEEFFSHVDDDVSWTVKGTHPLAGHYTSKQDFIESTFSRLNAIMQNKVTLKVEHLYLDDDTVIAELSTQSTAKNGIAFNNEYCWLCRFEGEKIVEVNAYLDSALVQKVISSNEGAIGDIVI